MAKMVKIKSPVTIRFKTLANGNKSVYLDIYRDGERTYEFLKLYIVPGKDPASRANNDNVMRAAVAAQAQRIRDIAENKGNIQRCKVKKTLDELCLEYIEYEDSLGKSSRNFTSLQKFLKDNSLDTTLIGHIDRKWFHKLVTALKAYVSPTTKRPFTKTTIHMRIQSVQEMLKYAYKNNYTAIDLSGAIDDQDKVAKADKERQYLTKEELLRLVATPYKFETLRNMFLFSCFTGLRYSDVVTLKASDVVKTNTGYAIHKYIVKTKKWQNLPLNTNAMKYIDINKNPDDLVFTPISYTKCRVRLEEWTKAANIDKHITFHCARHTFATLSLTLGADLYTVSKLLGHSNINTTQIYAKIVDEKKVEAVNLLDKI